MPKPREPGRCKAIAARIRTDAEQLAERLADGEHLPGLADEYHCNVLTFSRHLRRALGVKRYKELVHRGNPTGFTGGLPGETPPADEKRVLPTGYECQHCTMAIERDTRVCPNCNTLLKG